MAGVSYPKGLRAEAKSTQNGLGTVHYEFPSGVKETHQGVLSPEQLVFLRWAAAVLFCEKLSHLAPKLEQFVRENS